MFKHFRVKTTVKKQNGKIVDYIRNRVISASGTSAKIVIKKSLEKIHGVGSVLKNEIINSKKIVLKGV